MSVLGRLRRNGWGGVAIMLALVVGVVFGRAVSFEFTNWDDNKLIHSNPLVNPPTFHGMAESWKGSNQGLFIPVTYNVWSILAAVGKWSGIGATEQTGGVPAWPFHSANLLVHYLNALLVFTLLRRGIGFAVVPAVVGAAFFALHPLQVEAVCWATAMKDLLSTCFALGFIVAYLEAARAWNVNRSVRGHYFYSASLVLLFLGSLAKPGVVGAPLIAAILDVLLVSRTSRVLLRALLPMGIVLPLAYLTTLAQPASDGGIPLAFRPTIALHAMGFYLWKLFVPSSLCIDYGMRPLRVLFESAYRWLTLLPVTCLLALLVLRRWRRELAAVGCVFIAGVAPVLGLTPFFFQFYSTVADRYVYLSMLGPAMAMAYVFAGTPRLGFRIALVAGLLGLGGMSYVQAGKWKNSFSIMAHTCSVNPRASAAYNNMASAIIPRLNVVQEIGKPGASTRPVFLPDDPLVPLVMRLLQIQISVNSHPGATMQNMIWLSAKTGDHQGAIGLAKTAQKMAAIQGIDAESVLDSFGFASLYYFAGDRENARKSLCLGLMRQPGNRRCIDALRFLDDEERGGATRPADRAKP